MRIAKTKALISFVVTAKLISVFVFACAKSRFSHKEAHYITSLFLDKPPGGSLPAFECSFFRLVIATFALLESTEEAKVSMNECADHGGDLGTTSMRIWHIATRATAPGLDDMSRVMRKPDFCICENKDADQRLCFRYMDSTIHLLLFSLHR